MTTFLHSFKIDIKHTISKFKNGNITKTITYITIFKNLFACRPSFGPTELLKAQA